MSHSSEDWEDDTAEAEARRAEMEDDIENHTQEDNVDDNDIEESDQNWDSRSSLQIRFLQFFRADEIHAMIRGVHSDDEDVIFWNSTGRTPVPSHSNDPDRFPKVPSEKGAELMDSGSFGLNEVEILNSSRKSNIERKKKLAMRIFERELAIKSPIRQKINQRLMAQSPVYSGQFSEDGNFFFAVNKDFKVRMYDTSNPYDWTYYKTVSYPSGRWTLTDASLSPDNKYLAYTSIHSNVCLAPTDPNDIGEPYILDLANGQEVSRVRSRASFGIWSIRYSGDGRNLVAGTTDGYIVVYDIESRSQVHQISGHDEDVNAVCLADTVSPHILYSGSDDTTLKVWDTRSMGDNRAAGTFVGHIEGLTYIDSKGDGRYILSNGKDQSAKLWDLRMVISPQQYEKIKSSRRSNRSYFDYRYGRYDENYWYEDPHDCSLVTYRGHKVLKTLIRCHFSPPGSTNSRYIYSGSQDGKVYIWNLDAVLAGVIDVHKATYNQLRPRSEETESLMRMYEGEEWSTCVRDASWHPTASVIVASAWNGYGTRSGTCTLHSWNDGAEDDEVELKMGIIVDQKLRYN